MNGYRDLMQNRERALILNADRYIGMFPGRRKMQPSKRCPHCGNMKPLNEFYISHSGMTMGKPRTYCKKCGVDQVRERRHRKGMNKPLKESKDCASYLGVYVAERALSKFFDHIERMPYGNKGFDFICGKGYKIDVKSGCKRPSVGGGYWIFGTKHNMIADYFLCLAFQDREMLEPLHVWLIPTHDANVSAITISIKRIRDWSKYERPLDKVLTCCHELRSEASL
jgi:hypothetical protein